MKIIKPEFVTYIPETLDEGIIYISIPYSTAIHKCVCGCSHEVVTPFSPTDWKLIFDGETVSLYPSIGNWDFPCQSHYWITNNRIKMSEKWSLKKIEKGRKEDKKRKKKFYRD